MDVIFWVAVGVAILAAIYFWYNRAAVEQSVEGEVESAVKNAVRPKASTPPAPPVSK